MSNVRCNKCGTVFAVCPRIVERGSISCVYLMCPSCNEKYQSVVLDFGARVLQEDFNKSLRSGDVSEEALLYRRKLSSKIRARSDELKRKYPMEWFLQENENE